MKIRTQLTLTFTLLAATILGIFCFGIYYLSSDYRKREFYDRLQDQAVFASEFYFNVKGVTPSQLKQLYVQQFTRLVDEDLVIYDAQKHILFESGTSHTRLTAKQFTLLAKGLKLNLELPTGEELTAISIEKAGLPFYVLVSARDRYGNSKLAFLRTIMASFWVGSLGLMWLAGLLFAKRALTPIAQIIGQVNQITSSSLNTRVVTANKRDEIAQLATTFNQMLAGLEEAFAHNKSFVQHASHELRTPLTSVRGQLEVALMQQRSEGEYRATMESLLEDIQNMTVLTNGLLELSQLSNSSYRPRFEPVRVDALLWEMLDVIATAKPNYRASIEFDPETDENDLVVNGNQSWLGNCFKNLMENGCKFSQDNRVGVKLQPKDGWLVIKFIDKGFGISPHELDHIFEPFYRSENTLHIPGHGIGLSLCRKIVQLHGGKILVDSTLGKGTTFTVSLPLLASLELAA